MPDLSYAPMNIPLTKFGWPQVVVLPAILLAAMIILPFLSAVILPIWVIIIIELVLALFFVWSLIFFRDPDRRGPTDKNLLLAPADGRITDIETINEDDFISGAALRIGIFMSIFDVHINRAPCNVKIEKATYKKGKYKNAMNPKAGLVNESNGLGFVRQDEPQDRLIVRQISGAIARRIVCKAGPGQQLISGEKFGMVKFGSRTELYVPISESVKCLVKIGDKVKAGLTPIVKYEQSNDKQ
jgi:phosphatidylserine decarboxylase